MCCSRRLRRSGVSVCISVLQYVLLVVTDEREGQSKLLVRGDRQSGYHMDIFEKTVKELLPYKLHVCSLLETSVHMVSTPTTLPVSPDMELLPLMCIAYKLHVSYTSYTEFGGCELGVNYKPQKMFSMQRLGGFWHLTFSPFLILLSRLARCYHLHQRWHFQFASRKFSFFICHGRWVIPKSFCPMHVQFCTHYIILQAIATDCTLIRVLYITLRKTTGLLLSSSIIIQNQSLVLHGSFNKLNCAMCLALLP